MKKIILLSLLLIPACLRAQFNIAGIGGENGYSSIKAEFKYNVTPWFYVTPRYSYYQDNDEEDKVSRYGLRLGWEPGYRWELGAEGFWVPEMNGYSNYSGGADAKFYLLRGERGALQTLYLGAGADYINNKRAGEFNIDELRGKLMAGADTALLLFRAQFAKAMHFSNEPTGQEVIWEDMPFFTSVDKHFLDYVLGASVILPTEYLNVYAGYSTYKYWAGSENSQSLNAGATIKMPGGVGITGNVEFRDFDKTQSKVYYSLSSSISL